MTVEVPAMTERNSSSSFSDVKECERAEDYVAI